MRQLTRSVLILSGLLFFAGCDPAGEPGSGQGTVADNYRVETGYGRGESQRQRQAALLNRLRGSDPEFQVIERAIFNERNELGIVLDRSVEMNSVPQLMRSILTQMAREFPGEDLTIIAYAPTQPPMKIGTARLDARTRDMTYKPAQQNY